MAEPVRPPARGAVRRRWPTCLGAAAEATVESLGHVATRLHLTECWANVSEAGGSHAAHAHPNSFLSAVYFLAVPPEGAGALQFVDPRPRPRSSASRWPGPACATPVWCRSSPRHPGLVVFPSWLTHRVDVSAVAGRRITVAANFMPVGPVGRPTMALRPGAPGPRANARAPPIGP